ncbi:hypothetical protein ABRQ22_03085 [Cellulosimicrobium sp. ES-005]|uniref:Uncharacterized protein n=1 Tax=Cellulosimicrobium sp. ES-005 TaxID=3163031 RepID=A0AAU8G1W7_9MICO
MTEGRDVADAFPGGTPVRLTVTCRTTRRGGGRRHPVLILPDWSVRTPHDLDLERIAVAMGGYVSCVELADHLVPALREAWLRRRRVVAPEVRPAGRGTWAVRDAVRGCACAGRTYATAGLAAQHLREAGHWARRDDLPERRLAALLTAFDAAARPVGRSAEAVGAVGRPGLERLWDAGVHPARVAAIHAELGIDGRLPESVYLAVATGQVTSAWLHQFADLGPETLAWAATTSAPDEDDGSRRAWLDAGASREAVLALLGGPYGVPHARVLAALLDVSITHAATTLAGWVDAGCAPSPAAIARAARAGGAARPVPPSAAIDSVLTAASAARPDRTQVGLLLVALQSRPATLAVVRRGVSTLDEYLTLTTDRGGD